MNLACIQALCCIFLFICLLYVQSVQIKYVENKTLVGACVFRGSGVIIIANH